MHLSNNPTLYTKFLINFGRGEKRICIQISYEFVKLVRIAHLAVNILGENMLHGNLSLT